MEPKSVLLGDIVIHSEALKEYDTKARRLFNRIWKAHLKRKPDKCEFLRTEVAYSAHMIGWDGVKLNPAKL